MLKLLRSVIELTTHLVWPRHCPACGRLGVSFCEECLDGTFLPLPPFCLECGGKYGVPCCTDSVPCFAAAPHIGLARRFLIDFKYHNARAIGYAMGKLIFMACQQNGADLAMAIPLHLSSRREYNQSAELLRGFAAAGAAIEIKDVLRWRRDIDRQVGRNAGARRSIPPGAIESTADLTGKRVLIIDDVYTTGATLRAAREAVHCAGGSVTAACVWSRRVRLREAAVVR